MINLALKRNLNTAAILLILQIKMKEESLCLTNDEVIITAVIPAQFMQYFSQAHWIKENVTKKSNNHFYLVNMSVIWQLACQLTVSIKPVLSFTDEAPFCHLWIRNWFLIDSISRSPVNTAAETDRSASGGINQEMFSPDNLSTLICGATEHRWLLW